MDINLTLFGEMITFGVLVWFTMRYIWPPLMKAINDRQKKIADGLIYAERATHDLELARHESVKMLQKARGEATVLIEQAEQQVSRFLEDGRSKAHKETERLFALAKTDVEQERVKVVEQLRQETVSLAIRMAEKILQQQYDAKTQDHLIKRLVEEIK